MENKRLRPVLYRDYIPAAFHTGGEKIEGTDQMSGFERRGFFHRWADDFVYIDSDFLKQVFALVETYNGQVIKVAPVNLKFNDV